jgi:hypothetical protein
LEQEVEKSNVRRELGCKKNQSSSISQELEYLSLVVKFLSIYEHLRAFEEILEEECIWGQVDDRKSLVLGYNETL